LEIEIGRATLVVKVAALTVDKNLGRVKIVDGIAEGAVLSFEFQ
jgi:hypothetical protein